jgi:hypothetical protein
MYVDSILSLCVFSACPWESTNSVVIAAVWAMLTGLKGPLMLQVRTSQYI